MWGLLAALFFTLLALPYYILYLSRQARLTSSLPGPAPYPFIGNVLEVGTDPVAIMRNMLRLWRTYGNVIRLWLGPKLFVMTADPRHFEVLMNSSTNIRKNMSYDFLNAWLGTGLLTGSGNKWRQHRKLLTPAFHFSILGEFVDIFHQNTDILVKKLEKEVNKPAFNVHEYITLCALDIICETAMGVSVKAQENAKSEYVIAVKEMANILMMRTFSPWLHPQILFDLSEAGRRQRQYLKVLHGTTREVIRNRKQELSERRDGINEIGDDIGRRKKHAFLDSMLLAAREGVNITDEEIREEVDTLMFEGHDTTASAASFCVWLLSKHQDVQDKAYGEMNEIFGNSHRPATFKDLQAMKYLECVLKECLRLFPSVPFFGRELDEDVTIDGLCLPRGTSIGFMVYMMNRTPEFFPDPEKFDPSRFESDRVQGRHPYAYVPFSAGPRNCIESAFFLPSETEASFLKNVVGRTATAVDEEFPRPSELTRSPTSSCQLTDTCFDHLVRPQDCALREATLLARYVEGCVKYFVVEFEEW